MKSKTPLKILERNRAWRKNNPEKFKLSRIKWEKNNKSRQRELQKIWARKSRAKKANERAIKKLFMGLSKTETIKINRKIRKLKRNVKKVNKIKRGKWSKEKQKELSRKWNRENRSKMNEYERRRKVRKRNVIENFTNKQWDNKLKSTKGFCPNCNKNIGINKLTLDHTPPISKVTVGFIYTIDDVSPLCRVCNSRKSNKI